MLFLNVAYCVILDIMFDACFGLHIIDHNVSNNCNVDFHCVFGRSVLNEIILPCEVKLSFTYWATMQPQSSAKCPITVGWTAVTSPQAGYEPWSLKKCEW